MNVRTIFVAGLAILGVSALAEPLKYTVTSKGEKIGTFVEETTGDDSSGYVDDSTWELTKEGHKLTIHEIVHYGKDGIESSKSVNMTVEDHEERAKATLGDDGAKLSVWSDSDKDEKQIPLATKTSRVDQTNFWFKGVQPAVNDTVTYQSFDMQNLTWSDVTLKFTGKKTVKVGDRDVEANEILRTEGDDKSTVYVDNHGDALLVISDDIRIERDMVVTR